MSAIKSIETFNHRDICCVRVEDADGKVGIGQATDRNGDIIAQVLHRHVAPLVLGFEADNLRELPFKIWESQYQFAGGHLARAIGGLDTALWDLKAKSRGLGVAELLGLRRESVPVCASSTTPGSSVQQEVDFLKQVQSDWNCQVLKINIGNSQNLNQDSWSGYTEELIRLAREELGSEIQLMADAHSCYTPGAALRLGELLQKYNYSLFCEPCHHARLEDTSKVSSALKINIAGGVQGADPFQWERLIRMGAVDVLMMDLAYCGGFTNALSFSAWTQESDLSHWIQNTSYSMTTLFSLHYLCSLHQELPLELNINWPLNGGLKKPLNPKKGFEAPLSPIEWSEVIQLNNGWVNLPREKPGWGVELSEAWMNSSHYIQSKQ